jgi:hypothetical protein
MEKPEIEVEIRTKVKDEETARILMMSLAPDEDFELEGLRIKTSYEENTVITRISCSRGLRSLAETLNEVMLAYALVLNSIEL